MNFGRVRRRACGHGQTQQQCAITAKFRFGNRPRNQRLKAPFYALKSATKVPNLIDFACWGPDS